MGSRVGVAAFLFLALGSCGKHHDLGDQPDAAVDARPPDACTSLECEQVDCASKGLPDTTLTGTVYAPNGTLPLYGVNVYIPESDPGPLPTELACDRCSDGVPGGALALVTTDEAGNFTLPKVPAGANIPVVIQVGKWRRQLIVPNVAACQTTPITTTDTTLPKSITDASPLTAVDGSGAPKVDLPHIAITTGNADALECLILKLGIAPEEITNNTAAGHVHLYVNNTLNTLPNNSSGAKEFQAGWPGGSGAPFGDAETMWSSFANMSFYDIIMFSCEGGQNPSTKTQAAMNALEQYADMGGRVFMSHWHNIWIGGEQNNPSHGIASWEPVATWNFGAAQDLEDAVSTVDTVDNPKGSAFSQWLANVGASDPATPGEIPISGARYTCSANDGSDSTQFLFIDPTIPANANHVSVQDLQFTTPVGADADSACGKVVFSDMHVSSGSTSSASVPYPGPGSGKGCAQTDLSPQEKALAFIFFDISTCVGVIQ